MMLRLWQKIGTVAYWVSYPLLYIYLQLGWRTRIVFVVDDEVLLVKGWLGTGQWQLPGGGLHRSEEPAVGACRELKEEVGVEVGAESLKLLYRDHAKQSGLHYKYYCYLLKMPTKPKLQKQAWEILEMTWMPLTSVTESNTTKETYRAVQTWLKQSNLL